MKIIINMFISLIILFFAGCSVYMAAAGNDGVEPSALMQCRTRECLIAKGATPATQERDRSGNLTSEIFYAKNPSASSLRAFMHGVLDVGTLGIWEAVGTPIEGVERHAGSYAVKVYYEKGGDAIHSAKLFMG